MARDGLSTEQALGELALWGRERELNELDALMWRTERHPSDSWTGIVVMLLDSTPDWQRLRAAQERATRIVPRFRERVVDPVVPIGRPMWALDSEFDLDYHLRRIRLPGPGSMRQLLEYAQTLAVTPLDRTRPPWLGVLVEGLEGGRAAYLLQAQHVLMDGGAATQLFSRIMARSREPTGIPLPDPPRAPAPGPVEVAGRELARQIAGAPGLARGALRSLRRAVSDPGGAARYTSSLGRVMSPPPASASPLLEGGSRKAWRFGTLECPLTELKAAAKAADGTVNDAFVCAVLGGLRRYHERHDAELDDVPISMPVSVRRADELGGNRFTGAFFSAPSSIADPRERMAAMRERVAGVRSEPALDFINTVMPVLNRTPSGFASAAMAAMNRSAVLTTSSWRGVEGPVFMAGTEFERMFVFGPLPGTRLTAAMCSHVGTCCIGVNVDGEVFEDTDLLWECLQEGLDEILALAPTGATVGRDRR